MHTLQDLNEHYSRVSDPVRRMDLPNTTEQQSAQLAAEYHAAENATVRSTGATF